MIELLVGPRPLAVEDIVALAEGRARVSVDPDPAYRVLLAAGAEQLARRLAAGELSLIHISEPTRPY